MMRRTPLKRVSKPMKRTGFPRNSLKPSLRPSIGVTVRSWKSARPKTTPIRKAARGQRCTLCLPGVCNYDTETTVLAHSNLLEHGKGMGLKAPDTAACFACSACHDVLDGRAPRPAWMTVREMLAHFDLAMARTHKILRRMGLIPDEQQVA